MGITNGLGVEVIAGRYSQAQDWIHPGGSFWDGERWDEAQLVRIDKPGTFDVYAEVAAQEPAGFMLMANDAEKPLTVKPTGGAQIFQTQRIGQLTLTEGESEISIHPQESLWNPIRLRSVTLKPVEVE